MIPAADEMPADGGLATSALLRSIQLDVKAFFWPSSVIGGLLSEPTASSTNLLQLLVSHRVESACVLPYACTFGTVVVLEVFELCSEDNGRSKKRVLPCNSSINACLLSSYEHPMSNASEQRL